MTVGHKLNYLPSNGIGRWLMFLFVVTPFVTAMLNAEPIIIGDRVLPGLTLYDAVSLLLRQMIFVSPFVLGRMFLATEEAHRTLLIVLVVAGLIYSLPMLFEVRMSPQLHTWIYGFFPHSFAQQIRFGGFRPVVFLGHGLLVALFTAMVVVAAMALWRLRWRVGGLPTAFVAIYLTVVLVLCKSVAPMLYGAVGIFFVRFTSTKMQFRVAAILVLIAMFYPMLRGVGLVPVETAMAVAQSIGGDRAGSLKTRFDNEEILLAHANERPFFGWGSWGRNRVYDENMGRDLVITDGRWIGTMGTYGWAGYLAEFGLLALPILLLMRINRRDGYAVSGGTAALSLIYAINIFDLLPNSPLTPWTWLLAGSLLGMAEQKQNGRDIEFIESQRDARN